MDKTEIRKIIKDKKKALTVEQIAEYSDRIIALFMKLSLYKNTDTLYVYASYNQEVRTKELVKKALNDGKKVYFPKVIGNEMEFFRVFDMKELELGAYGILEPTTREILKDYDTNTIINMILPGLVFDLKGNRIGYGGGFYDKFLANKENEIKFKKIAFAYEFQVFDNLETKMYNAIEEYDKKVEIIITQNRVIKV